jgi:hypothetical protein
MSKSEIGCETMSISVDEAEQIARDFIQRKRNVRLIQIFGVVRKGNNLSVRGVYGKPTDNVAYIGFDVEIGPDKNIVSYWISSD